MEFKTPACSTACQIMYNEPDFTQQKGSLQELIEKEGHICDFYPKFHPELNFIEQYWGAAKYSETCLNVYLPTCITCLNVRKMAGTDLVPIK